MQLAPDKFGRDLTIGSDCDAWRGKLFGEFCSHSEARQDDLIARAEVEATERVILGSSSTWITR